MNIYMEASKAKLRFSTERGPLSTEQLWDLPLSALSNGIKSVKKLLKKNEGDDELSFLDDSKEVDVENGLRFEILKDVYLTRKKENEEARNAAETKAHNQKILGLIQGKKEEKLNAMSVEDLEALLK